MLVTHHIFKGEAAAWRRVYVLFQRAGLTEYEKEEAKITAAELIRLQK